MNKSNHHLQLIDKNNQDYKIGIHQGFYKLNAFHTYFHTYFIYSAICRLIRQYAVKSVVEIGGAEGYFTSKLKEMFPDIMVLNVEASVNALKNGKEIFNNDDAVLGDILSLPFGDKSFDLVICSEVLEHIEDYKKAVSELRRIAGKVLLITTPACHSETEKKRFIPDYNMKRDEHIHYFMKNDIAKELLSDVTYHAYFHSWFTRGFLSLAKRILKNIESINNIMLVKIITYADHVLSKYLNPITKSQLFIEIYSGNKFSGNLYDYDDRLLEFILKEYPVNSKSNLHGGLSIGLHDKFVCPVCRISISMGNEPIKCEKCGMIYRKKEGFVDFLIGDG